MRRIIIILMLITLISGCSDLTDDLVYYDSFDNNTCIEKIIVENYNETHNKETTISCQEMGSLIEEK
ncbi:unnamed protein product [marine sediment metagenome]|uniref:Uncharacterized protein n=1 Tax=marine sediment metagenome TaxID=412755 RepID=X0W455_9ZZZZ